MRLSDRAFLKDPFQGLMPIAVRVPVVAFLPDTRALTGAIVRFWPNTWKRGPSVDRATGADGRANFQITYPLAGPLTTIRARWAVQITGHDQHGVTWIGGGTGAQTFRPRSDSYEANPFIPFLDRGLTDVSHLKIEDRSLNELALTSLGNLVLDDLLELNASLRLSLPVSSLSATGKVLDGFLKVKGESEGWWDQSLDDLTLGGLLQAEPVKAAVRAHLPAGEIDRLRGSAVWVRNVAAHQKYAPVSLQEALASAGVVLRAMNIWK